MIELVVLNADFEELGSLDDFSSLVWTRKYYETGDFELHCPPGYFRLLMDGEYLWSSALVETGIIQDVSYSKENKETIVKGRFLEDLLSGRIITDLVSGTKTPEVWAREWVTKYCISPADSARKLANLSLGPLHSIGTAVPVQTRGDDLLTKIRELTVPQACGVRLLYDYPTDKLRFEVYQGLNRCEGQSVNSLAVFSDEEESSALSVYTRSAGDHRNFAYVAGAGEDNDRTVIGVDRTNGQPRRELWVDARDLQREDGETDAAYRAKLIQRGEEKLAEYPVAESADFTALSSHSLVYRKDYDLGDNCTAEDRETGIRYDARVEEVTETWEGGSNTVTPVLGASPKTIMGKVKREVGGVNKIPGDYVSRGNVGKPGGLAALTSAGKLAQMPTAEDVGAASIQELMNAGLLGNHTLEIKNPLDTSEGNGLYWYFTGSQGYNGPPGALLGLVLKVMGTDSVGGVFFLDIQTGNLWVNRYWTEWKGWDRFSPSSD